MDGKDSRAVLCPAIYHLLSAPGNREILQTPDLVGPEGAPLDKDSSQNELFELHCLFITTGRRSGRYCIVHSEFGDIECPLDFYAAP